MMKQFRITFLFLALITLGLSSCGNKAATTEEAPATEEVVAVDTTAAVTPAMDGPEYTSAYVCPMHCAGSGSAEAGTCPACGMDYVMNTEQKTEENHEGHEH